MMRLFRLILITFSFSLFSNHAYAVAIDFVTLDRDDDSIYITGSDLALPGNASPPSVTLGGAPLTVVTASETLVHATLPDPLPDGEYTLTVSRAGGLLGGGLLGLGGGGVNSANYSLTIATLLKGDKGDKGDPGMDGADGMDGQDGAKGDPGPKGDKGDPGLNGADGMKGDKGDKGDQGNPGPKGDKGDKGDPGQIGPFTPGEYVQFAISDEVVAPNNNWVNAYEVEVPRGGGLRVEYHLFEKGSNLQWREARSQILVNDVVIATKRSGTANNVIINYDLLNLNPGDRVRIRISVENADQSPYIDAHINNFKLKASEPSLFFSRIQ